MKPITLNISGLNSFIQEEIIDFSSLMQKGLFGIFGPTGSGKSSILDAITIALYGEISRETTGFINTETGELYVRFEFTGGSNNNYYTVERKMKMKDEGGYRTSYARLITDRNTEKQQIYDGVREIEEKINDIIGLNHEDFMRTVVLPQGKFSKFLKLTGRKRRDMLERILGLEQFGRQLMDKLKKKRDVCQDKLKEINGVLNKYEEINSELLQDKKNKQDALNKKYREITSRLKKTQQQYEKYREIWKLQQSLKDYKEKQHSLLEKKESIDDIKQRRARARKANSIKTDLKRYQKYCRQQGQAQKRLAGLEKEIEKLVSKRDRVKTEYEECVQQRDEELPHLVKKKSQLEQAQALKKKNKDISEQIKQKETDIEELKKHKQDLKQSLTEIDENINKLKSDINDREKKIDDLKVTSDYRKKINQGLELENEFKRNQKQQQEFQEQKQEIINDTEKIADDIDKNEKELVSLERDIFLNYEQKLSAHIDNRQKLVNKQEDIDKKLSSREEERAQLEKLITEIKNQNMAAVLAQTLEEGRPCPVCGAEKHPRKQQQQDQHLSEKEAHKQQLGEEIEELKSEKNGLSRTLDLANNQIEQLEKEKNQITASFIIDCQQIENDEIEEISDIKIDEDDKLMQQLQENRNTVKEELIKLRENMKSKKAKLEETENKLEAREKLVKKQGEHYDELLTELEIDSFQETLTALNKKDEEFEKIQKQLKQLRADSREKSSEREQKREGLHKSDTELTRLQEKLGGFKKIYQDNRKEIKEKAGEREPALYLKEIENREQELRNKVDEKQKLLTRTKDDLSDKQGDIKAVKETLRNLDQEISGLKEYLEEKVEEYDFKDIAEAGEFITDKEKIDSWQQDIEKFDRQKQDIENNIKRLHKELDDKSITEKQWQQLEQDKENLEAAQHNLQQQIGGIKNEIKKLEDDLKDKKKYKKSKNELEHELSLIEDINSLIRGKSFVEFVAIRQLRYIAREASRRLMEITNNRYRLELDKNGEFVICDNFNGGVKRDCNTLSGGETFLTSLSLALALSSHIQLKGSSSMEFFFLDEGFGTLDNNLLDIVMNSLEKLQDEELAVGIISHVEELKNRVPIKLMVKSAEPGLRGSSVDIRQS